jgi:integrase/recombinase XerD
VGDFRTALDDPLAHVLPTDRELIEEFVALVGGRRTATLHKYRQFLLEFAAWLIPRGSSLLVARRPDLIRFLAYLASDARIAQNSHGRLIQQPLGASSRKGAVCALRLFYRHCNVMEYLDRDPTLGIETPRVTVKRGVTIDAQQLQRLLDADGGERCRVQAFLFVYTLARLGSLAELRWSDIDFVEDVIHFDTAKGDRRYSLPLHARLRRALTIWRRAQLAEARANPAVAGALEHDSTAYVLLTRSGRPVAKSTLAKQLKWRAARAGVLTYAYRPDRAGENKSGIHPHVIRRSVATLLRKQGTSLEDIADLLNHRDINVTRTHYAFTDTPEKRRAIERIRF